MKTEKNLDLLWTFTTMTCDLILCVRSQQNVCYNGGTPPTQFASISTSCCYNKHTVSIEKFPYSPLHLAMPVKTCEGLLAIYLSFSEF